MRFRDAALVAAWLATAPAMAGTPVANSEGMEIALPNLVPIPVAEPTPAAGATDAPPVVAPVAVEDSAGAEKTAVSPFETLIADFRWGSPEMGAYPHLPVPPPHKMRAEDGTEDGEGQPLDGNSGNALPLQLVSSPLATEVVPAANALARMPAQSLRGVEGQIQAPTTDWRREVPNPGVSEPAANPASVIQLPAAQLPAATKPREATTPAEAQAAFEQIERQVKELGAVARPDVPRPTTSDRTTFSAVANGAVPSAAASGPASPTSQPLASAIEHAERSSRGISPSRTGHRTHETASNSATTSNAATPAQIETRLAMAPAADRTASFAWLQQNAHREGHVATESVVTSDPSQPFTLPAALAANVSTPAASARADAPVLQLSTPMATPEWADGLGERVVWLTNQNLDNAHIRLNPAHLGPVEVRVSVADDRASVAFVAHHSATREALESAAPRLREMLQAQGFSNVNVEVGQHSHQSAGQRAQEERPHYSAAGWSNADDTAEVRAYQPARAATSRSVLDTFA